MKKIILSSLVVASMAMASENISINKALSNNTQKAESSSGFFDRFHAKGDLRLRHEMIEKDGSDDKNRERFRFRYSLNVDITDNFLLETAISTGKGNPTSGNVSFRDDDNIADYFVDTVKVDILDLAYKFDNSWIRVGKSKHHIYRAVKTQLVWDNDIRLEGMNYGYKNKSHMIRVGANRVNREPEYEDGENINMFIAQYINTQKIDDTKLNLGVSYYLYDNVKGNTTPYGSSKGNSVNSDGFYAEEYGILELFTEVKQKDLVMNMPLQAAITIAYNTLASDDNFAYDISAQLGATKKAGDFKVGATYRKVAKDAVFGAHNDSGFSGGETDSKGYYFKGKYKFAKNVDIGAWFNWSKLGDTQTDYHRTQLDVIFKF